MSRIIDTTAITHLVDRIRALTQDYDSSRDENRLAAIRATEELLTALKGPSETIFSVAQQFAQNVAMRTAIELGLFQQIQPDGTCVSASELASSSNADVDLIVRIMRACTTTGIFQEVAQEVYTHNSLSKSLVDPANRALITLMYDINVRGMFALPEFLSQNSWRKQGSYHDCAFQLGAGTALGVYEYIDREPRLRNVFDLGMQSKIIEEVGSCGSVLGPYPFVLEVEESHAQSSEFVFVDVGGGRGQALAALRAEHPGLQGRFILQDLDEVIQEAVTQGLPGFIEPMIASFFNPQPIRGADIYYLRRVLHNWNDQHAGAIVSCTASAMTANSKLLITDMVVPDINAPREMAWEDLNMMSMGGVERTERQWRRLLADSGLTIVQIWKTSEVQHATIEARRTVQDNGHDMDIIAETLDR